MARDAANLNEDAPNSHAALPNRVTVVGHGIPASFEITVDGAIEAADDDGTAVVSEHAAEGAIEAGSTRFRFSGDMANAHVLDRSASQSPTIHVEYGSE
ncbi:hypothetical protein [Natronococcus occultus]|uniref:Uncharacterized protein n=1 Tax=Natronococcus occultus SP4 TaxID=694430 RepID=L0K478_9EURY|nr:hypothetical protein [Natronococcus occultus]AGB38913.1 hypothetical protein Natoc_3174 [Natronococcus occultus SP4]